MMRVETHKSHDLLNDWAPIAGTHWLASLPSQSAISLTRYSITQPVSYYWMEKDFRPHYASLTVILAKS